MASIHAQFISQVASVLERSISGFLIRPDLKVSSAGYTTPFIFSVYLTPSDFDLAFLWYISISRGLHLFSIIFSALFESRLVLGLLTEIRDEFSHCTTISAFMYTKFAAVNPGLVPGPLGFIICLCQRLILGILDSAQPAFGFDPGLLASASTMDIGRGPLQDYTFTLITGNPRPELLTSRSSIYALGLRLDSSPSLVESLLFTATFSGSSYTVSFPHIDAVDIIYHENNSGHKLCLGAVLCSYAVKLVSSLCGNLTQFLLLINLILYTKSLMSPATLIDNHYAVTCCLSLVVITVGVSPYFTFVSLLSVL